jgi:DNA-binding NtrC family response regulator
MNLSIPILIADEHEEIRSLQREMLARNGFFHLVEAHSKVEVLQMLDDQHFLIIHSAMLSEEISKEISRRKNFLIVVQNDDSLSLKLAARFGVAHLISFPYSARSLVEKINQILN